MIEKQSKIVSIPNASRHPRSQVRELSSAPAASNAALAEQFTVMAVFGTRPEIIKLAPVLKELGSRPERFDRIAVTTSQHADLSRPLLELFDIRIDFDLQVMRPGQSLNQLCAGAVSKIDTVLCQRRPNIVLVQGDTTTALAGALAAWHQQIPVGHVEAGLRTGKPDNPFPEEMNRRLISHLASVHFAATAENANTLMSEGVPKDSIALTGNPVVDAVETVLHSAQASRSVTDLIGSFAGRRIIVLTTHRRESFGPIMRDNMLALRNFVVERDDVSLVFPVHPNPAVRAAASEILAETPDVHMLDPLNYPDFIHLLANAWLIVSDSGGIQEEAPSLRKPLLIIREDTERQEALECGIARLVSGGPQMLALTLEALDRDDAWIESAKDIQNPFGRGDSASRIVAAIEEFLSDGRVNLAPQESANRTVEIHGQRVAV